MSGVAPPTVDALRRVRRRTSGTHLWTWDAGRAGTRIRSEALHRMSTIGRPAADRAGARPYHRIAIICETVNQGLFAETLSIRPRSGSNPRLPLPLTVKQQWRWLQRSPRYGRLSTRGEKRSYGKALNVRLAWAIRYVPTPQILPDP